jgi:IclR family pca regulon transcriptional regulator
VRGDAGDEEFVQSLAKGLAVIESFAEGAQLMTLSDVSRRVGLSPGSARRVLHTLHILDYVSCKGAFFELTPRVLRLGYSYLTSLPIAHLARARLAELAVELDADMAVSVRDGADVVFVARATAGSLKREPVNIGIRLPAHATAAGKVLLAALDRAEVERLYVGRSLEPLTQHTITTVEALQAALDKTRQDGWAVGDQEADAEQRWIAAPLCVGGDVVAAIGMGATAGSASAARMVERLPRLRAAADEISELLRRHPAMEKRDRPGRRRARRELTS